eukprot:scaffold199082_cov22-Tisochrysis_lutea.AAC.3
MQHTRLARAMMKRKTELQAYGSVPLSPAGVPPQEWLQHLRGAEDMLSRAAAHELDLTSQGLQHEQQRLDAERTELRQLISLAPGGEEVEAAARAARAQLERCRGTLYLLAHL